MKKLNILALDQATHCGWCASKELNGVWNFSIRSGESVGMRFLRFRGKLAEVCKALEINTIVYERVAGHHANALIHGAKMVAMIETYAEENGIEYKAYPAKEIKMFATGKGSASKEKMVEYCKINYGIDPEDDNHADAIHLWHLATRDLQPDELVSTKL